MTACLLAHGPNCAVAIAAVALVLPVTPGQRPALVHVCKKHALYVLACYPVIFMSRPATWPGGR